MIISLNTIDIIIIMVIMIKHHYWSLPYYDKIPKSYYWSYTIIDKSFMVILFEPLLIPSSIISAPRRHAMARTWGVWWRAWGRRWPMAGMGDLPMENLWKTIGKPMEHYGKPQTVGKPMENPWKNYGTPIEHSWKTYGKPMENSWKPMEKHWWFLVNLRGIPTKGYKRQELVFGDVATSGDVSPAVVSTNQNL